MYCLWTNCFFWLTLFAKWTLAQEVYCPGSQISYTCTTAEAVIWTGTLLDGQCPSNMPVPDSIIIQGLTEANISGTISCGRYDVVITNVKMVADPLPEVIVTSSLTFFADVTLNGSTVRCRTSGIGIFPVNTVLVILGIPVPALSSDQVSLTALTLTLTVDNSRCASLYVVEIDQLGSGGPPITVNSSTPNISVTGLDLCTYYYSVVGYVQAPSGVRGERSSSTEIQPDLSGLQGVVNVRVSPPSTLEWTQLFNGALSSCITGYTVSWNGGELMTSTNSVSAVDLNGRGFPYCQTLLLTVTPITPVGPVTTGADTNRTQFRHPDLVPPEILASFAVQPGNTFIIRISWQTDLTDVALDRVYGFRKAGGICEPQLYTTDSSVSSIVLDAEPDDVYMVCVTFINNECMESANLTVTVPEWLITDPRTTSAGDTGFSVTVSLPESPPMDPSTLSIFSTIDPPHASATLDDYPNSSQQYTVTFRGLTAGTTYSFVVRIVFKSDITKTIGLPLYGSFDVQATLLPISAEVSIALTFILTFLLTLVLGVSIGVLSVLGYQRCRRSGQSSQTETEMETPTAAEFEEPVVVKPDPQTQENVAYEHVQFT